MTSLFGHVTNLVLALEAFLKYRQTCAVQEVEATGKSVGSIGELCTWCKRIDTCLEFSDHLRGCKALFVNVRIQGLYQARPNKDD